MDPGFHRGDDNVEVTDSLENPLLIDDLVIRNFTARGYSRFDEQ